MATVHFNKPYVYAIVPSIKHWSGDQRRDNRPYMTTLGISYGDLNVANMAMRELNRRGIKCHLEIVEATRKDRNNAH